MVAIRAGNEIWISLGSDQCDRELDHLFPDKPKQMCPHPIASVVWPYDEVKDVLTTVKGGGLQTAILSNGSPKMLASGEAKSTTGTIRITA